MTEFVNDDFRDAVRAIGFDAAPTGLMRYLVTNEGTKLQALWKGIYGGAWVDVPTVIEDNEVTAGPAT